MSEACESLLNGLNLTIFEAHKSELAPIDHAWDLL
jgi:hypothetical protein